MECTRPVVGAAVATVVAALGAATAVLGAGPDTPPTGAATSAPPTPEPVVTVWAAGARHAVFRAANRAW